MKKIFCVIIMLSLLCGLVACGNTAAPAQSAPAQPAASAAPAQSAAPAAPAGGIVRIGVVVASFAEPMHAKVMEKIQEYVVQYEGKYEFQYENSDHNMDVQFSLVENMINNGCKVIIIIPVNSTDGERLLQISNSTGVPIIPITRQVTNPTDFPAITDNSNISAGEMCAEFVVDKLGESPKIAVLLGRPGNVATIERTQGYHNIFDPLGTVAFVAEEYGEYSRVTAMGVMETWLQAGIEFDAIMANNDEMAIGAALVLQQANIDHRIIAGVDGTNDGVQAVRDGLITVTAMMDAEMQAKMSVEQAIRLIEGIPFDEEVPQFHSSLFKIVSTENVGEFS